MGRLFALLALAAVSGVLVAQPAYAATGSAPDAQILSRVNAARVEQGLRPLRLNPALRAAARAHSRELAQTGQFQHESADGTPFWQRVARYYGRAGFRTWSVAETLYWTSTDADAASVVEDWLASPPHRAILLDPRWHELGVAAARDASGATVVTADFGVRSR